MTLANKVRQFTDDLVPKMRAIVHGDKNTVVETEGGPVRSLAKLIADHEAQLTKSQLQRAHMKRISHRFPLLFPDYAAIIALTGNPNVYPQAWTIDEIGNEILFMYCGTSVTSRYKWVVAYDRTTSAYKGCFGVGQVNVTEGMVVRYIDGKRYLETEHLDRVLGRYDITTRPENRSTIEPVATFDIGLNSQISFHKDRYFVEQAGTPLGMFVARTTFAWYDADLNRVGAAFFDKSDTGFAGETAGTVYWDKFPKRQGCAVGDGYVVFSYGGYTAATAASSIGYGYQGIKLFNLAGACIAESIMEPLSMMQIMHDNGVGCTRIENEGAYVDKDGKIFTFYIHRGPGGADAAASKVDGIVVFEEMSAAADSIDFSPAVRPYNNFRKGDIEGGVWPRLNDKLIDPILGAEITTLDQMLDFMYSMEVRQVSFYGSGTPVLDLNGVPFAGGELVTIQSTNNSTFLITVNLATVAGGPRYIRVTGAPGARVQTTMFPQPMLGGVRFGNTEADATNKINYLLSKHYTNAEKDFAALNVQCTAGNNSVIYGGGSSLYNAATRHQWFTATNTTTSTGTERMRLDEVDGLTIKPVSSAQPNNNGEMLFELTSNTTLTVRVKGSDGVVRSTSLNLV